MEMGDNRHNKRGYILSGRLEVVREIERYLQEEIEAIEEVSSRPILPNNNVKPDRDMKDGRNEDNSSN